MGLMMNLLTLPLAPVRLTVALADQIRQQAEREYYDPARIRREIEEIGVLRENGAIEPEEADALEDALIARLLAANDRLQREP